MRDIVIEWSDGMLQLFNRFGLQYRWLPNRKLLVTLHDEDIIDMQLVRDMINKVLSVANE